MRLGERTHHLKTFALISIALLSIASCGDCGAPTPAITETLEPEPDRPASLPKGFAFIKASPFTMGSPDNELKREAWNSDERQREVTLTRDFLLQTTEVTQSLWMEVIGPAVPDYKAPFRFGACGETCPAETVSWFEAIAFANLYSKQRDKPRCYKNADGQDYTWQDAKAARPVTWEGGLDCEGYRLPTEAEWELAARGRGTNKTKATYAGDMDEDTLAAIAWYVNNSQADQHGIDCTEWDWKDNGSIQKCGPQPVATKRPNNRGLHDMLGNVWEWTWDWYGAYPARTHQDPHGPDEGQKRVLRGCSWYIHPSGCRAAKRSKHEPDLRNGNLGFRLAISIHK